MIKWADRVTQSTPGQAALRVAILTPVVLLLLFFTYRCFHGAVTDILATQVRYQLAQVQYGDKPLDSEQWKRTHKLLEQTLKRNADRASYLELAAQFYQELDNQESPPLEELRWHENEEKALAYSRRALLLRPSWLYLWDNLVVSKVRLKQYDSELTGAMERAINLGPWDESVQYDVATLGLDAWDGLDQAARETVTMATERSIEMLCQNRQHASPAGVQKLKEYCTSVRGQ